MQIRDVTRLILKCGTRVAGGPKMRVFAGGGRRAGDIPDADEEGEGDVDYKAKEGI
jgi:hypothetical protein